MTKTRMTVAVTGTGGGVGQAILRALRRSERDYRVLGLDMNPRAAGLYESDVARVVPPANSSDYVSELKRIAAGDRVAVLLPGSDPELPELARARPELERAGLRVLVGEPSAVSICRDKLKTARFFRERGFPFVQTVSVGDAPALAREVGFPLIIKPVGGSASRNVTIVFDEAGLTPMVEHSGFIAQEFAMPSDWAAELADLGPEAVLPEGRLRQEEEISVQVVLDHEANHLGTFCSVNRLQAGVPIYVDPRRIPSVEDLVERMATVLVEEGLIGPCNFQCRMTSEGPKVFEINPRFTGITGVRAAMGFNEVEGVLDRLLHNVPLETARSALRQPSDVVSCRFVDELIVPRSELKGE
ncbi:MAG: ATP-grasp domain-containing protein [Candidatus Bipolaricaulia bacterium]